MITRIAVSLIVVAGLVAPVAAQHHNQHDERALGEDPRLAPGQIAPVLEGLGDHHHAITTSSDEAQRFFDQGLLLTYGFNHQEALRAFKEAARLDPDAAMTYWGWALVLGPNLNLPMRPEVVEQAYDAIQDAVARRNGVSEKERAMIEALALRYSDDPDADRGALNASYADAMRQVRAAYPDDLDVATLYGAALMNESPWDYWTRDARPKGNTVELLETLEWVIAQDPHHEGALHYYIHAVEPVDPERGVEAADLLHGLTPGAGHLVHMPSHIYMQVGRYEEAYQANVLASRADEGYLAQCRAQGIYPLNYYPHNVHFLAWAAIVQGKSEEALAVSRKVASNVPMDHAGNDWSLFETFLSMPLYTMVRFGMGDEILAEPPPPESALYFSAIWRYARGMAFARTGKVKQARRELTALSGLADDPAMKRYIIGFSRARTLLAIATELLSAEIDARRKRYDDALRRSARAARLQDGLAYTEPPDWYYPVRHTLGAVLLESGHPAEAEVVYWQDLKHNPDNGWALYGLWQSFVAQGREEKAEAIKKRFDAAWSRADLELTASRF